MNVSALTFIINRIDCAFSKARLHAS